MVEISDRFVSCQLLLNINKADFSSSSYITRNENILIEHHKIKRANVTKFLGIKIDNRLTVKISK